MEVPAQLSGLEVERDDRAGVQVVPRADASIEVGRRIPGSEHHHSVLEVDRRRLPDASATALPCIGVLGTVLLFPGDVPVE
jgi:hypothetical protein